MRSAVKGIAVGMVALVAAPPAHAQRNQIEPMIRCTGPADNPWLTRQPASASSAILIDAPRVFPLPPGRIEEAVGRLVEESFVALDDGEVAHFLGAAPDTNAMADRLVARAPVHAGSGPPPSLNGVNIDWNGTYAKSLRGRLRPYLVRGVLSVLPPVAQWRGEVLSILSGGIGCGAFTKLPMIVYLEKQPAAVTVEASAIL